MECQQCESDRQWDGQAMHSNGCPYCCARFIRWVKSSNRVDKQIQIEETLRYAERYGITRDQIREHYKAGRFHQPKQTFSEKASESGKPVKTKRRLARKS